MKRNTIKTIVAGLILVVDFNVIAMEQPTKRGQQYEMKMGNPDLNVLLMDAIFRGSTVDAQKLIEAGADVNLRGVGGTTILSDAGGHTILMLAASNGDLEMVKFLIAAGANPNLTEEYGGTALMTAAMKGYAQICKLLIENGANVYARWRTNTTALHSAATHCKADVAQVLLTTIPRRERDKILQTKAAIMASQLAFKKTDPTLPKDIRRLVTQPLIDDLVNEQMGRAAVLIPLQNWDEKTARDLAIRHKCPAIAHMLDLTNPTTQATLKNQIEANILRIFSEPNVAREECPICMATETWNIAPCCKQSICPVCWEQSLERTGGACPFCRRTHLPKVD